jgi:hypothetical protein
LTVYQLTRRAANASWSDRTANIGKAKRTLAQALAVAVSRSATEGDITVTDVATGLWGVVGRVSYQGGKRHGTRHIELSLPCAWVDKMRVDGEPMLTAALCAAVRQSGG